jgi:hypothetical protein
VLALLIAQPAAANNDTIFDALIGYWQAEGNAFGAPSTSDMRWIDAELGGKFLRLEYRINRTTPDGPKPIFSGIAYYQKPLSPLKTNDKVQAFWADTNGNLHPILAVIEDNVLISNWGTPDTEQGRTRYQLSEQGTVEVTDWVKTADGWRQFNHTVFTRAKTRR